jgi:predicted PurR-regulated permease PerM
VDLATIYKPEEIIAQARNWGSILMQNALGIATSVATATFNLLLVLILSIYIMVDQGRIARGIVSLVPASYQDEARFFGQSVSRTFGGFIRGQLLQALIYGVVTTLVMIIAGLDYAVAAGAFGGLIMLVPFIGGLIALLPPLFIGLLQASGLTALIVVAVLFIAQMVIANVLMPAILSEHVGLPPLLIFAAMLVGIRVAGFWGALFGIPVMGVVYAMAAYLYKYTLRGQAARDEQKG